MPALSPHCLRYLGHADAHFLVATLALLTGTTCLISLLPNPHIFHPHHRRGFVVHHPSGLAP
jgi:hypothetical protein